MSTRSDRFWHHVAAVLSGSAVAQAIPIAGALVLARLYVPSEFGVFATWLGLVAVAAVVITGRFEMALAIEPDGWRRRVAVSGAIRVVMWACIPLALAAVLGWAMATRWALTGLLWLLLVPCAALIAVSQIMQNWAAADGRYRDLTWLRVTQAGAITLAQIAFGWWHPSATSLALAHALGVCAGVGLGAAMAPRFDRSRHGRLARLAFYRRQKRFPLLALPADSINTAAAQLPLLIVAARFGADKAGLLAMTLRMVGAPIGLLGAAVLDVFRRRAAASFRAHGNCRADYLQTFKGLTFGALCTAAVLGVAAEPLFAWAFGERWRDSGTLAAWLMPMFALRFVASPLSYVFYIVNKQHIDLAWQTGLLGVTLASLLLPDGFARSVQWYGAGYAAMYVIYLFMSYRYSRGEHA